MKAARFTALSIAWVTATGCGLLLDGTQPPSGLDAGSARDAGRSTDAGTTDGGAVDGGAFDGGRACADGSSCTLGVDVLAICVDGVCVASVCGDGVVDRRAEECDDGDDDDTDGCTAECEAGCVDETGCPIAEGPCVVETSCVEGRCQIELEDDGTPCTPIGGEGGTCMDGRCVAPLCGNGSVDLGEECDDGNHVTDDGCEIDCTFSCDDASECDDGIYCNGTEACVASAAGQRCETSAPAVCPMTARCDWRCDAASDGCVPIDADGDLVDCTEDCDDESSLVGGPSVDCWPDEDDDGYGADGPPVRRCACSPNEVEMEGDCDDDAPAVNPGAGFSATPRSTTGGTTTWDWNCDGEETREVGASSSIGGCPRDGGGLCVAARFWQGEGAPNCGEEGVLVTCAGGSMTGCRTEMPDTRQRCR